MLRREIGRQAGASARRRLVVGLLALLGATAGCESPEATRARGGRGADPENYRALPLEVPSKLDGTKDLGRLR